MYRYLLLWALSLAACSQGATPTAAAKTRPPPLVEVVTVTIRDLQIVARGPVDLRPTAQADLGSKILGYLDAVLIDRGDLVKKGQLLAIVRPSDLPDQLAVARGNFAQARAAVELAKANDLRTGMLRKEGLANDIDVVTAKAALASAQASEAAAHGSIAAIATRLGETKIVSPIDGVVWQRKLDPGVLVGPPGGTAIVSIAKIDVLRAFVAVNESAASALAIGQDTWVEFAGGDFDSKPGNAVLGKVVRLSPTFDTATRTLEAEVHINNDLGTLRPGMYGRAKIVIAVRPKSMLVPVTAVQLVEVSGLKVRSHKDAYVFVLTGDSVVRRKIEIGVDEGDEFEVISGLRPGDQIVSSGTDSLSDGAKVRVAKPASSSSSTAPATSATPTTSPKSTTSASTSVSR